MDYRGFLSPFDPHIQDLFFDGAGLVQVADLDEEVSGLEEVRIKMLAYVFGIVQIRRDFVKAIELDRVAMETKLGQFIRLMRRLNGNIFFEFEGV